MVVLCNPIWPHKMPKLSCTECVFSDFVLGIEVLGSDILPGKLVATSQVYSPTISYQFGLKQRHCLGNQFRCPGTFMSARLAGSLDSDTTGINKLAGFWAGLAPKTL